MNILPALHYSTHLVPQVVQLLIDFGGADVRHLRMENLLLQEFDRYNSYSAQMSAVLGPGGSLRRSSLPLPQNPEPPKHEGMDALAHAFAFCGYDIHLRRRQDSSKGVEIVGDVDSD